MSQIYSSTAPPTFLQMVELDRGKASQEHLMKPTYYNTTKPTAIANPGALYVSTFLVTLPNICSLKYSGIFSFASTTLMLSLFNVRARGVATPNVVVGMAIFTGGLVQLLAGMWEFPRGNVFGATGE
jgi:hypothetical protein